ncbi:MAG: NADP-dependent oxidoreductase [Microthrixaceae bacterium]
MRALILDRFGKDPLANLSLRETIDPTAASGHVLVRMTAAALNPSDLHIASGEMKMMSPRKPPFPLGVDGAGVVDSDGHRFRTGDRVMFYTGLVHCGTVAEAMAVPEDWLAPVPQGWTASEAAAAPLALLVAYRTLERSRARAGERLLVHGAGGAVGAATVALAHGRGLTVCGSGSGADETYVRDLGASAYIDYRTGSVRDAGERFDIVLDGFGGNVLEDSAAVVNQGGRIVSLKAMTGTDDMDAQGMKIPSPMKLLMPLVFRKPRKLAEKAGATLIGIASFPDGAALEHAATEAVNAGFRPRIDRDYPLDRAIEAVRHFATSNPRGKVVIHTADAAW